MICQRDCTDFVFVFYQTPFPYMCANWNILLPLFLDQKGAITALAFIGRFMASGSFSNIYLYSMELYPTTIRWHAANQSHCLKAGSHVRRERKRKLKRRSHVELKRLCVVPVYKCEMQTQAQMEEQGNEKFSISCVGACASVCISVLVVHTCVCLRLHLRFRLRWSCEPAFRQPCLQSVRSPKQILWDFLRRFNVL